jgi:hypothetical protein
MIQFPTVKFHEIMFGGSLAFIQTETDPRKGRQEDAIKITGTFLQIIIANGPEADNRSSYSLSRLGL